MIIVRIHGGLGNQMFQYAFGRSISYLNNVPLRLDIGGSWPKHRIYELHALNIIEKLISRNEIKDIKRYRERGFRFDENFLKIKFGYFDGYWQTWKYFSDPNVRKILLSEFIPKNISKYSGLIDESLDSIGIHIRRGDYLNLEHYHGLCSPNYYKKGIAKIAKNLKNPHIYVFSDDIPWVKENLVFKYPVSFLEGNPSYIDMLLMSICKHQVISNSTFSWWPAWLNQYKDKSVIAPRSWFTDPTLKSQSGDIMPKEWTKI